MQRFCLTRCVHRIYHPYLCAPSFQQFATDAEAAPAGVQSWYDSGLRLDGVVAPTAAAPAPEPEPVVEMAAEVERGG